MVKPECKLLTISFAEKVWIASLRMCVPMLKFSNCGCVSNAATTISSFGVCDPARCRSSTFRLHLRLRSLLFHLCLLFDGRGMSVSVTKWRNRMIERYLLSQAINQRSENSKRLVSLTPNPATRWVSLRVCTDLLFLPPQTSQFVFFSFPDTGYYELLTTSLPTHTI